jgi:helix-turn-helix protein
VTQRETVLHALRVAGRRGVTNGALNRLGVLRYSSRIFELRRAGYEIRTENGKDGRCVFYLISEPSAAPPVSPPLASSNQDGGGEQAVLFEFPRRSYMDPTAAA